jgi:multiple antibiotic resistance protein
LARRIAINNVLFLGATELLGSAILYFFGISLLIVQVAGGMVVVAIAWGVLNENDSGESVRSSSSWCAQVRSVNFPSSRAL